MLPNLDAQLAPYSRTRAVQPSAQRPGHEVPATMLPPGLEDQALDTASLHQLQSESPPRASHTGHNKDVHTAPAGVHTAKAGLLGDVTNTAAVLTTVSPRDHPVPMMTDFSLDSVASSPGKRHSPGASSQHLDQQQLLDDSKQHPGPFSGQKRLSVDTRGSLKQSVFQVSDLHTEQHSLQTEQALDGAPSQPTFANLSATNSSLQAQPARPPTGAATSFIKYSSLAQQPARMPLGEQSDPSGNRAAPLSHDNELGHATSLAEHSPHAPHSLHDLRGATGHSPRALPQAQTAPGLMSACSGPDPEAVQAANRAALLQTAQRAQQADSATLATAVAALQPLVAVADLAQLQQCLPQVCT